VGGGLPIERCWPSGGGASSLYVGHIYFERNVGARQKNFCSGNFARLKYEVYFIL
jgi:hypothetical protein